MHSTLNKQIHDTASKLGLLQFYQHDIFNTSFESTLPLDLSNDCTLIVGDNLANLFSMAKDHSKSIDFCYIDPPYNTGTSFLYLDKRVSKESGVFGKHTSWMLFMLPRLIAAKEIIKQHGVIAVSIDDYEQPYLRVLMDTIFGEHNLIGNIVVCRSKNGKGSKRNISPNHEYLLIYGNSNKSSLRGTHDDPESYDKYDSHGPYRVDGLFRKKGEASLRLDRPNMFYPLYYDEKGNVFTEKSPGLSEAYPIDSKGIERRWLWSKKTASENSWKLYASPNGVIYVKNYYDYNKRKKIKTLWQKNEFYTERATLEIKRIFGDKIFDTPKPLAYIKEIIDVCCSDDAKIMDFFAGSGTTAHAVYELNQKDGGSRKVLLMESCDKIPLKHTAFKNGYEYIYQITDARVKYFSKEDESYLYSVIKNPLVDRNINTTESIKYST